MKMFFISSILNVCVLVLQAADENELVANRLLDEQVKLFQSVR